MYGTFIFLDFVDFVALFELFLELLLFEGLLVGVGVFLTFGLFVTDGSDTVGESVGSDVAVGFCESSGSNAASLETITIPVTCEPSSAVAVTTVYPGDLAVTTPSSTVATSSF